MGKKILLFVSLVLTAFAFNANASIKITVKKAGFDPVYLYAWDNEDKAITAAWPGTKMSANADGTYSLTLDVSSMNLLFHNGSGTQTADIKGITEDACFSVNADGTYKRIDCTTGEDWVAPTPAKVKVNFIVPLDWKTVNVFGWDGASFGEWPGTAQTPADGIVTVEVPVGSSIIFNNGTDQTVDIKVTAAICYALGEKTDGKYAVVEDKECKAATIPVVENVKVNFIVPLDWKTVNVFGWDGASFGEWPGTAQTPADGIVTVEVPVGSSIIFNNGTDQTVDIKVTAAICYALGEKTDGKYAVVEDKECKAATIPVVENVKVNFIVPLDWKTVNVFGWDGASFGEWPGTAQTPADGIVTVEVPVGSSIIFNNGTDQTVDIKVTAAICYALGEKTDGKYAVVEDKECKAATIPVVENVKVNFIVPLDWKTVNVYGWDGASFGEWPGTAQTPADGIVTLEVPVGSSIIFNNGTDQTVDIKVTAAICYALGEKTDGKYAVVEDKECKAATIPVVENVKVNFIVPLDWKTVNVFGWDGASFGEWPGTAQTPADGIVTVEVPVGSSIIFNNGTDQTVDIKVTAAICYALGEKTDGKYAVVEDKECKAAIVPVVENVKVNFIVPLDWKTVNVFGWDGASFGEWPGTAQTPADGIVTVEVPVGSSIIFNNGTEQTVDIKVTAAICYALGEKTDGKYAVVEDKECKAATIPVVENVKVNFIVPLDWKTVNVFGWDGASFGEWPGTAQTPADGIVTVEVPVGSSIIFNNGTDQTVDIKVTAAICYALGEKTDGKYAVVEDKECKAATIPVVENVKVNFIVPLDWKTVNVFGWDGASFGEWPGTAQTPADGIVTVEVPVGSSIIFNNGTDQTVDIKVTAAICYALGEKTDGKYAVVEDKECKAAVPVKVTYTVVGDNEAIFGKAWEPTLEANDMLPMEQTIEGQKVTYYVLLKENVELKAGIVEWKVAKNHSWDVTYGDGNANKKLTIEKDGKYNIAFTFVEFMGMTQIEATAELVEASATTYYVAGNKELTGLQDDWVVNGKALVSNGIILQDVPAGTHQFKITDGTWVNTYGFDQLDKECTTATVTRGEGNNDNNIIFTTDKVQNIIISIDPETKKVCLVAQTAAQPAKVYTVVGEPMLLGISWNYDEKQNDMTLIEGVYTLVKNNVNLPAYTYEYKVVEGRDWGKAYPSENAKLEVKEDGVYKVTFTYKEGDQAPAAVAEKTDGVYVEEYYVAGSMNGWNAMGEKLVECKAVLSLTAGSYEFKITNGTWGKEWNSQNIDEECSTLAVEPVGGNNIKFTLAEAQDVTIEFDAQTQKICVKGKGGDTPIVDNNTYYIVGELVPWGWDDAGTADEVAMTKIADNVYEYVVESFTAEAKKYQYKLRANKTWTDTYQLPAEGNAEYEFTEAGNYKLVFTADVAQHALTLVATKLGGDTPQPAKVYTVVGEPMLLGISWNYDEKQNDMTLIEGVYTLVKNNVNLPAYTYEYKVVEGRDWGKAYPSENAKLEVKEDGVYKVTFTYKEGDQAPAAVAEKTDGVYVEEYYVAGSMNGWNAMGEKLVEGKAVLSLTAGSYEFKITNGTWGKEWNSQNIDEECSTLAVEPVGGNNIKFTLAEAQDVTIEFDAQTQKICVKGKGGDTPIVDNNTYYIVGELVPWGWDDAGTADEVAMTKIADNVYEYVVESFTAEAKKYQYKLRANKTWTDTYQLPAEGNAEYEFTEAGNYKLVFTADVAQHTLTLVATKLGGDTPQPAKVYTVVGEPMLLGINWNYDEKQNDMTLIEGVYTLVKNNVNLPAYTYEYKVVEGRDWGKAYPSENAKLEVKEDGVYKVTFTYKEGDQAPAAVAEKTDGVYVEEYYVAGSMNGWNAMGEKLVEGKAVLSLTAGSYEFKITNGTWGKEWNWQNIDEECSTLAVEPVGGNNIKFTLAEAQDVTIEFDAQTQKICVKGKGGDTPQPEKVYSVVGEAAILNTTTDWDVASDLNDMTLLAGIYTLVVEKDVAAGTYEYKVAVNHAWDESYPAQGNVSLTIEETAKYRIVYTYVVGEAAPSAILTKIEGPEPTIEKLYMIGEIEGTNYTWAPNLGVEMTALGGNLFSLTTTIANQQQGEGHFGIVSKLGENADDWATINANRYGPQENDALLVDQVPQGLYAVADNAFKVANGRYTITVDMTQMNIIAVADFTAVDNLSNGVNITVNGSELSLTFNGEQTISVYSVTGQQMTIAVAQDEWHTQLTTGMYVVMVGNEPFKVIVR